MDGSYKYVVKKRKKEEIKIFVNKRKSKYSC